jgi:zinc D-Ala-D-Ala carboxypeptidase
MRKHWSGVLKTDWPWQHFQPIETACKHCGLVDMHSATMHRLERLRTSYGAPITISSGFRCPEHPVEKAKTKKGRMLGVHTHGRAVDIKVYGAHANEILWHGHNHGFTGIGVHQKGLNSKRFIHLDDTTDTAFLRPTLWSY